MYVSIILLMKVESCVRYVLSTLTPCVSIETMIGISGFSISLYTNSSFLFLSSSTIVFCARLKSFVLAKFKISSSVGFVMFESRTHNASAVSSSSFGL